MKVFPSNKAGQSPKVNSHEQAMAWSQKHVSANNTKAVGAQAGTKMTKHSSLTQMPKNGLPKDY